jgi:flavin reductase (DIM6/NTAB) family NADH-FMN oxidoreductase RutF
MWSGIATEQGARGAPLLVGALGWLECRLAAEHEVGDHSFFVGEVESVRLGTAAPPLVHHEGGYRTL